jgi:hypothetical protein
LEKHAQHTESSANTEGPVAKAIDQQTAKMPSDWFLWAALSSIGVSLTLQASGRRHASMFVGQWAPTFLILGLYNKVVKQLGSDASDAVRARRAITVATE